MNKDNNKLISVIVVTIFLMVFSYQVGFRSGEKNGKEIAKRDSEAEIMKLNKALDIFSPPQPAEIFSVFGEIKAIEDNGISLEINSLTERRLPIPGEEQKKELRKVIVNDETQIIKIDFNSIARPVPPKPGEPFTPPQPKEIRLKITDLKIGDRVNVTALENIKVKTEFVASKIQL